ncbi:MAG: pyruvate dehydrogenase complex E1 component subunit beta [Alphaproteobacteria bacterium]|nr:MAG: pyruvate dehydrogenase complex E1 component subunit beta [Alphaproteobacteria bacterium]
MTIEILLPAMSPTMTEGTVAKWTVAEGDKISAGDILAEIETDKATMELETDEEGVIGKIIIPGGTEGVAVGTVIGIILEDGEDSSSIGEVSVPVSAPAEVVLEEAAAPETQFVVEADLPEGTTFTSTTVREALRDAMAEEMRLDDNVFIMGEEVAEYEGAYKVTQGLHAEFGDRRVIDTPITEHGFAGLGVGAAMAGLKPVVEFMTFNFAMQAIDHIINSAAKTNYMSGGQIRCPMVFRGPNGAASRVGAQHSQNYAAWYAHVPGLIVVSPYSAADAKGLLKSAIKNPNPVIFLENEMIYGQSFEVPDIEDYTVPLGKAKVVRAGTDVTLVSYSIGVKFALEAAEKLAAEGIDAEVIDLRTLRPLDMETVIKSVQKTNRVVCVEEGWVSCSISSEISARLMEDAFDYLDAPVLRVTNEDVPMPYAANLEKLAVVNDDKIVVAVRKVCYTKGDN